MGKKSKMTKQLELMISANDVAIKGIQNDVEQQMVTFKQVVDYAKDVDTLLYRCPVYMRCMEDRLTRRKQLLKENTTLLYLLERSIEQDNEKPTLSQLADDFPESEK